MWRVALGVMICLEAAWAAGDTEAQALRERVEALRKSLDKPRAVSLMHPFADENRLTWSFLPGDRNGLALKELDEAQQQLVLEVLRTGLSGSGFDTVETIRSLDQVLRDLGGGPERNPANYYLIIFGEPSDEVAWAIRFEGHHVSLTWTIADGNVIATTPQFLGANPAEVRQGPKQGTRALGMYEDLARSLLKSLDDAQRTAAVVNGTAPADILTRMESTVSPLEDIGVAYGALNDSQKGQIITIIESLAKVQAPALAETRLKKVREAGLDSVKFAWMGGLEPGEGHYYRIQGPTFLIEYDNTQNGANHVHLVWRDFKNDFGRDLLKEHYQQQALNKDHGHGTS